MPITFNGSGTVTGITAGGLPDGVITTDDIAAGAVTTAKITGGPAFSAYRNATQSASASTWTKIQLNAENFDTASAYDSTTNYRFTPLVAGYYFVTGTVDAVIAGNTVLASLYKNGAEYIRGSRVDAVGVAINSNFSTVVYMNGSTDFLELYGYTTATGGFSTQWTSMSGCLIRPA